MQIIPAILEKDLEPIKKKIALCQGIFNFIQIDICDNQFTQSNTWHNPEDLSQIKNLPDIEIHLMVNSPLDVIDQWSLSQVKRIVFHLEPFLTGKAIKNNQKDNLNILDYQKLDQVIQKIRNNQQQVGLAINPETSLDVLDNKDKNSKKSILDQIDTILFLGVTPGKCGQEFQEQIIDKIKTLKDFQNFNLNDFSSIKIGVDGGVNPSNANALIQVGADYLAIGSYFWQGIDDLEFNEAQNELRKRLEKLKKELKDKNNKDKNR